jgi:hypothetical protein
MRYIHLWELPPLSSPESKAALLRAEASWRRMLTIQPAVCDLRVVSQFDDRLAKERVAALHFEQGVRMGVLWDIILDEVSRRSSLEFLLGWHATPVGAKPLGKRSEDNAEEVVRWRCEKERERVFG